jgi:hypothetical protein
MDRKFNDLLTAESLSEEYEAWCKNFVNRNNNDLRFGQYIWNKYGILGKSAPEIFYAENVGDAYWRIVDVLIQQEI